ncbi:MAG: flagellar basal body rod protein FlgB [Chloroflexota bacterium]|nr:flagellar basal body rod protein FlgB [Chloroflexota bacterium]
MSSFVDNDLTVRALQFSLDGLSKRAQVASNDIANADTPNYKASVVTFEDNLRRALAGKANNPVPLMLTDGADIDPDQVGNAATITETPLLNLVNKNDANNVDVDREMTTLAETNIMYDTMVQLATSKLQILKSSVQDVKP